MSPPPRVSGVADAKRVSVVADAKRVSVVAGAKRVPGVADVKRVSGVANAKRISVVSGTKRVPGVADAKRVSRVADARRVSVADAKRASVVAGRKRQSGSEGAKRRSSRKSSSLMPPLPPYILKDGSMTCGKVFRSNVYVPWYKRYNKVLPDDVRSEFQIFRDEEQEKDKKAEENKTSKKFTAGKSKNKISIIEPANEKQGHKVESMPIPDHMAAPITDYLAWARMKQAEKIRSAAHQSGGWMKYITPTVKRKILAMAKDMKKLRMRQLFVKTINVVLCLNRFLQNLKDMYIASDLKLKQITNQMENIRDNSASKGRLFDITKYRGTGFSGESAKIPFRITLILTKPWFTRTLKEIEEVVDCLHSIYIFVKYPKNVARQFARVAWYSKLSKSRPIIRQSNPAGCFGLLLSGLAKVTTTSTDVLGRPYEILHRHIVAGELFGEDDFESDVPVRRVSVTTVVLSELISIDYEEYQKSLLNPLEGGIWIPRHLKVVKNNIKMNSISLLDIIANASQCFPCMYFPSDTIITENMRTSRCVYLVLQGYLFSAKLVSNSGVSQREEKKRLTHDQDIFAQMKRQSRSYSLNEGKFGVQSFSDEREKKIRELKLATAKQTFEENVARLSKLALTKTKAELAKEMNPRIVLKHFMSEHEVELTEKSFARDIAKKVHTYELGNQEYGNLSNEAEKNTIMFKKLLSRFKNEPTSGKKASMHPYFLKKREASGKKEANLNIGGFNILVEQDFSNNKTLSIAEPNDSMLKTEDKFTEGTSDCENTSRSEEKIPHKTNDANDDVDISEKTNENGIHGEDDLNKKSIYFERVGDAIKRDQVVTEKKRNTVFVLETRTPTNQMRDSLDSSISTDSVDTTSTQPPPGRTGKSGASMSYFARMNPEKSMNNAKLAPIKPSSRHAVRTNRISINKAGSDIRLTKAKATGPYKYRTFKKIQMFRRWQLVGHEYMDFNDGKYRQPKDYSLVSGGAELVMVDKSFLLKHLYKQW